MSSKWIVAPDAIVRFKLGKIWIHTAAEPTRAIVVERTDLVNLLHAFANPREPDTVVATYPAPARPAVADMIRRLQENGLLIAATPKSTEKEAERATAITHKTLADLANSVYGIASDLRGLGPHAQKALGQNSGVDVSSRVAALLAAVDGLADELRTLVDDYLRSQLEALRVAPGDRHLKLHIGAGGNELPGWVNIDVLPAQLAMNIKWGLPFESGAADYVFMSHLFEHLFYPREALDVLQDIHGVLAPGGVLRIIVPDVEKCIRAYVENDRSFFESRSATWDWWPEAQTRLEDFLAYAGAGPDPGRLFDSHKFGYDFETLESLLKRIGFSTVERSDFMASRHEVLQVDDASLVAGAKYGDKYYSLFVEAVR